MTKQHRDPLNRPPDFPDDPEVIEELIEEALQRAAREGLIVAVAATNKCLAQSNKSCTGAEATKKRNRHERYLQAVAPTGRPIHGPLASPRWRASWASRISPFLSLRVTASLAEEAFMAERSFSP